MGLIIFIIVVAVIKAVIDSFRNREDPYKEMRKISTRNAMLFKEINSKPASHNKVGALSIVDQEDNSGKLSITDPLG